MKSLCGRFTFSRMMIKQIQTIGDEWPPMKGFYQAFYQALILQNLSFEGCSSYIGHICRKETTISAKN